MPKTSFTLFFGDDEYLFCLTPPMIKELENVTSCGIGMLYNKFSNVLFSHLEICEVIRVALVGGGLNPERAKSLVAAYAMPRPIGEVWPLAADILSAAWNGVPEEEPKLANSANLPDLQVFVAGEDVTSEVMPAESEGAR